jgi:MSHA biogenesis protein MshJ
VNALTNAFARLGPLAERLDARSLRERALVFGAGVAVIYMLWQSVLMDPLAARARVAEQHLADARRQTAVLDEAGAASAQDPVVAAAARNRALAAELVAIDTKLRTLAQGYVAPERMTELLRELLASQHGLRLVSLANLPVESLSRAPGTSVDAPIAPTDRGPFLHPVDMVVEGDYASVLAYLQALEALPWRIHWERVELVAGEYPLNRVHVVMGALSLSRDWISV